MAQTHTPIAALIPTGKQIYDAIMGNIEPELLSEHLPLLEQQYAGEPDDARVARMERYKQAFRKYDELYTAWIHSVQSAAEEKRQDAFKKAEVRVQERDKATLQSLDAAFDSPAA